MRHMHTNVLKSYEQLPLRFEAEQDAHRNYTGQQNRNQSDFVARGAGYSVYLTASGATFVLNGIRPPRAGSSFLFSQKQLPSETLRMTLEGANPQAGRRRTFH